jgi:hypothetical protein
MNMYHLKSEYIFHNYVYNLSCKKMINTQKGIKIRSKVRITNYSTIVFLMIYLMKSSNHISSLYYACY